MAQIAIKSHGGITVRVIEALNGFRSKFGYWPTSLQMEGDSIACLATELLTPFGFFSLQSRVLIDIGESGGLLAKGHSGHEFDYGVKGWRTEGVHAHDARAWLGLIEEYEVVDEN